MKTIKVGIAGTHSTGKSTLIAELESMLKGRGLRVKRVEDLATDARTTGFPILRDHTFESTLWIMSRGISCELEASLEADVVLVDRPVMDALAYLFAALGHRGSALSPDQSEYLLDLARHHARTYAMIWKMVLDPGIPLGPGRDQDMSFRAAVASELDAVFSRLLLTPRMVEPGAKFVHSLVTDIEAALR